MYIADIIPLMRIPRPAAQVFSYFIPRELPAGALVEVPVGRRVVKGVVAATRPVRGSKLEIRKSAFMIKSVKKICADAPVYDSRVLDLAAWIADRYWLPLGGTLALFPFLENASAMRSETQAINLASPPPVFVQETERLPAYVAYIQKALEEKKQTLVLCPDVYMLRTMHEELSTRMNNIAVFAYGGTRSKKKTKEVLAALQNTAIPTIVIGTRSVLFLPFTNLGVVIIDSPGDTAYEAWEGVNRYHAVEVAEKLAGLYGAQLIYGDSVPTVDIWRKMQSGALPKAISYKLSAISCEIIDLRRETHWSSRHQLTIPLKDTLRRAIRGDRLHEPNPDAQTRKQVLVLINRKGVATAFVCRKCGYIPRCEKCEAAMVLHGAEAFSKTAAGILRCHHCGISREPPKQCPTCDSYRIWPIGSGTVQVERDVKNVVPEARVLRVDSDVVKTDTELERRMHIFRNHKADILVGTQLMLKEAMLPQAALGIVLGAEQFFVFPEYNAAERVWHMFETLRQKTTEQMVIQTLDADMPMLKHFAESDYATFLDKELKQRKAFDYPPFGELAKLTFAHIQRGRAFYEVQRFAAQLATGDLRRTTYDLLGPSPAFIPRKRSKWKFVILLKFPENITLEARNEVLAQVPPSWRVEINPREIL